MQAVATKELRSRMRGARAFAILTIYLLLLTCLVVAVYAFTKNVIIPQSGGSPPPLGRLLFYSVTLIELFLIAPLAPSLSASAIVGERERQTFDLVMTTPLSARAFVLGKLASSLSYSLLLIFVALPIQVLALMFGGLTLTEVVLGFWMLIVTAVFYACSSIFFSAVMRSTVTANVFSYLVVILSLVGAGFVALLLGLLNVGDVLFSPTSGPSHALLPTLWFGIFLVSLSPLSAGIVSAISLLANTGTFLIHIPPSAQFPGATLLSPWVLYSALYLAASALLLWQAIRAVRPVRARSPRHPTRPSVDAEEATS